MATTEPKWAVECRAKGGTPGYEDKRYPVCYLPNAKTGKVEPVAPTVFNGFSLTADFSRFLDKIEHTDTKTAILDGIVSGVTGVNLDGSKVVESAEKAQNLRDGVSAALILACVVGAVLAWGAGVQAGILPPMRKVFK